MFCLACRPFKVPFVEPVLDGSQQELTSRVLASQRGDFHVSNANDTHEEFFDETRFERELSAVFAAV